METKVLAWLGFIERNRLSRLLYEPAICAMLDLVDAFNGPAVAMLRRAEAAPQGIRHISAGMPLRRPRPTNEQCHHKCRPHSFCLGSWKCRTGICAQWWPLPTMQVIFIAK